MESNNFTLYAFINNTTKQVVIKKQNSSYSINALTAVLAQQNYTAITLAANVTNNVASNLKVNMQAAYMFANYALVSISTFSV